jgi:ABC-2 type transport system ATP-binding protein
MSETILLDVQNLSKYYGNVHALKGISFSIKQGEIVGFLGGNGAGKSTTMRILSGCMSASDGKVSVLGQDIQSYPIKTKQEIGYLPEQPPLYPQMRVLDYLEFVATIKNTPNPKEAAQAILGKLQLDSVARKFIDQLSKGYKQRVGLAQALIHSPKLLILDEPTSGLDPAQRSELRGVLLKLRENGHSILLSTHILSEVEAICSRVIIISQGEIRASQALGSLAHHQLQIELSKQDTESKKAFALELQKLTNVSIISEKNSRYLLNAPPTQTDAIALISAKYGLRYFAPFNALEELYLQATGEKK